MTFFQVLPYTPHFVEVYFRFVQTTDFLLSSLLRFIINLSQTFINACKFRPILFWYIVSTLLLKLLK